MPARDPSKRLPGEHVHPIVRFAKTFPTTCSLIALAGTYPIGMTVEARILFVLIFFMGWASVGLIAWAAVAVLRRGRGAIYALPVSLFAACAFGVFVPLAGMDDASGFFLSLGAAVVGALFGYALVLALQRRLAPVAESAPSPPVQRPPRE
jgi:hypothetical protein